MTELSPTSRRRLIWVPNVLTVLRFALTVAFPFCSKPARLAVALAAGISDFVDGYIARRFGLTSWIGGVLDALADKAFTTTALLTLAIEKEVHVGLVAVIFTRDITVLLIAIWTALHRRWEAFRNMPSRPLGKWTTMMVFFALCLTLIWSGSHPAAIAAMALAGGLSIAAAADYLVRYVRAARSRVTP